MVKEKEKEETIMQKRSSLPIFLFLAVTLIVVSQMSRQNEPQAKEVSYTEFKDTVTRDEVASVTYYNETHDLKATLKDKKEIRAAFPADAKLTELLEAHKVAIEVKPKPKEGGLVVIVWTLISFLPIILIAGFFIFMMRNVSGGPGGGSMQKFIGSRTKLLGRQDRTGVTFAHVAGIREVKEDVQEIVEFLKNPTPYRNAGAKMPKGILLVGPSGTGKTLLARAIAGEANVPFFLMSGSEFVEMFVGVGAARVRDLFEQAKKSAPCIIFIDEIDAVGKRRGGFAGTSHTEHEQTLNQLLTEMDGFLENSGVIVIGATNRPEVLDSALLRPGRFNRKIMVHLPDVNEREAILKVHAANKQLSPSVALSKIAKTTHGMSGAELADLINEAAIAAARGNRTVLLPEDFEVAKDRMYLGSSRKSRVMAPRDKAIIRYHEAGHTIAALCTKRAPRPHKVTIIPRGMAGGFSESSAEDRMIMEREDALAQIIFTLGGRAAEELFSKTQTSGASDDLAKATKLARKMVYEWGMGSATGLVNHAEDAGENFLGSDTHMRTLSDETKRQLDAEVKSILYDCYVKAKDTLQRNQDKVLLLAKLLDEQETVMMADVPEFKEFYKDEVV